MIDREKVIKGLKCCGSKGMSACASEKCPYYPDKYEWDECTSQLANDALELLVKVKCDLTPFDVLNEISASYYGKQMFFLEKNGIVYDRYKHEYITFDDAVSRMAELVGDDGPC